MQWLFEGSTEAPGVRGFCAFLGVCSHLSDAGTQKPEIDPTPIRKIPHVGWNSLAISRATGLMARRRAGRAGVLHALVCRAGHRGRGCDDELWSDVCVGRGAGANCGRAVPPGKIQRRRPPDSRQLAPCCLSASSRAWTFATARWSRASTSSTCAPAGDPAALAARYNREGIDEIVILDVTATLEARHARAQTIQAVARHVFLPLCVGGGIRTEDDASAAIDAGADKVSLNSAALADPSLISRLAARYGSQAVIVAIDAKRGRRAGLMFTPAAARTRRRATRSSGRARRPDRGAGEILLTSIDRDGTKAGFDCDLTAAVSHAVPIPVIASGGAGTFDHFAEVFTAGSADAALAASIFHFNEQSVGSLKEFLAARGIPVRR